MANWVRTTWGDVVSLEYGKALRDHGGEGPIRVYGSNGPIGWTARALVDGPGVILGRKGAYRGVEYSASPFHVIDTAYYVVPKVPLDLRWLYYAIKHHKLGEIDDGSPIPSTTRAAVYVRELELPPLEEQVAMTAVLAALDDKIELNRRMNETLEAMAQAIFRDWFVDFGPVHRKIAGATDPVEIIGGFTTDVTRAAELAALFAETFATNGLPSGWRQQRIEEALELAYGKALPKTVRMKGRFPVYGSGGVSGTHSEALVAGPGIIVGRKGTVGSLFWEQCDFFPIDTVFYVVPRKDMSLTFLWHLLGTLGLEGMNTDAAVPGLNRSNVYRLEFPCPPSDIRSAFDTISFLIRAKVDANNAENRILAEIRDYLLPRLMSGEVEVRAQELALEEVL